jgi:hypothetical protein
VAGTYIVVQIKNSVHKECPCRAAKLTIVRNTQRQNAIHKVEITTDE